MMTGKIWGRFSYSPEFLRKIKKIAKILCLRMGIMIDISLPVMPGEYDIPGEDDKAYEEERLLVIE